MIKDNKIIILIFFLALLLRLAFIARVPATLSMDEVNIGYNAYSILKTSRDEWGNFLPLAFKSVGDYKPPVNIYLTVISIAIFGLNEFAVRLPTALIGALTSIAFIFLLKEMKFEKKAYLFSGFWIAILPWHIHFSRAGYEAITALFFLILATWAFLRSIHKRSNLLFNLSIIEFSLSVWAYHAQRAFVPLLFIFLVYLFRYKLKFIYSNKKQLLFTILIAAVFILPFLYLSFATPAVRTRALATSVFRDPTLTRNLNQGDNDIYLIFRHISGKYLNYFNLRYTFWSGLYSPFSGLMSMGLLYMIDLPLFILGVIAISKQKKSVYKNLIIFWFFIGSLPASLTMNEQHSLRALTWLPFWGFITALGSAYLLKTKRKILLWIYIAALSINIIYFTDMYSRQFNRYYQEAWQYGYGQIAQEICTDYDQYDNIVITDTFGHDGPLNTGLPYVYALFYCKYDPATFIANRNEQGVEFYNFKFRRPNIKNDTLEFKNTLLIGSPWDFEGVNLDNFKVIKTINYYDGTPAFLFVEI